MYSSQKQSVIMQKRLFRTIISRSNRWRNTWEIENQYKSKENGISNSNLEASQLSQLSGHRHHRLRQLTTIIFCYKTSFAHYFGVDWLIDWPKLLPLKQLHIWGEFWLILCCISNFSFCMHVYVYRLILPVGSNITFFFSSLLWI